MSTEGKSYTHFFKESWQELEKQFRREIVNPQQENDVVCYLYHALAKRLQKKGWPLLLIRTEDTRNIRRQLYRPDLNLNDRLFVEVKIYPLRKYGKGWKRRKQNIAYCVNKLEKYVAQVRSSSSVLVRKPVLALWFWKDTHGRNLPVKDRLVGDELERKLGKERERYKDSVIILYGPKRH